MLATDGGPGSVPVTEHASADGSIWLIRTALLTGGLFVLRLVMAALVPLDLAPDEAYYWDWSRQLDWGYYSKPPMVAWLIAGATALGGSTDFVVRLPAMFLGTACLWWMYALGARLYGPKAGFWTALLAAASPGNAALSLIMTIDAPFLFFWCAAYYCGWRVLERGPDRTRWLLAAILSTGLGFLSKESMWLGFFPLTGLFLLTSAADRREFLRPGVWIWLGCSLLFLIPVLWWNQQHGWITFQHSSTHFVPQEVSWVRRLTRCGEFLAGQLGAVSPVTCGLFAAVSFAALRAFRTLGRRERYLLCFSGLPMCAVVALSLVRRVEPNWPGSLYGGGLVLVVGWALGRAQVTSSLRLQARSLNHAVIVGIVMTAATYAAGFGCGLQGSRVDAMVRLRGWHAFAAEMDQRLAALPRPDKTLLIAWPEREVASELAFYLPAQPRVYLWNATPRAESQYDIWGGPLDKAGWDGVLIVAKDLPLPAELAALFDRVEPLEDVWVPIGWGRSHAYALWRGEGFRQWPRPPLAKR